VSGFVFTPSEGQSEQIPIPYFEDARADYAPYYRSSLSVKEARKRVLVEFDKLDAINVQIKDGWFGAKQSRRYGYVVRFLYMGQRAKMQVAGLPMRSETEIKIGAVRVQALLILADWLKAQVTARVFAPGTDSLTQFLLVDGDRTVGQYIAETRQLPSVNLLPEGIIDGEVLP